MEKKKKYTTIRISVNLADKIRSTAKKEGRRVEFIAKRLIEQGLKIEK